MSPPLLRSDVRVLDTTVSPGIEWPSVVQYADTLWGLHMTDSPHSCNDFVRSARSGGTLIHQQINRLNDSDGCGGDFRFNQLFVRYSVKRPTITPYDSGRNKWGFLYKIPLQRGRLPDFVSLPTGQLNWYQKGQTKRVIYTTKDDKIQDMIDNLIHRHKETYMDTYDPNSMLKNIQRPEFKPLLSLVHTMESDNLVYERNRIKDGAHKCLSLYNTTTDNLYSAVFNGIPPQEMLENIYENQRGVDDFEYHDITHKFFPEYFE